MSDKNTLRRSLRSTAPNGMRASTVSILVSHALANGISIDDIAAETGISLGDLMEPEARLPEDSMSKLWSTIIRRRPDADRPIDVARAAPISALGGLAHGAQFATDLGGAVRLIEDNQILLASSRFIKTLERDDDVHVITRHPVDDADRGRTSQLGLGLAMRLFRDILEADGFATAIDLFGPAHGPAADYAAFFGVPVRFEQPMTRLVLPRASLAMPVSQANPTLFAYVEEHLRLEVARIEASAEPAPLRKLRAAIVENALAGFFDPKAAAARANMSHRSAQRLAQDNGLTLQALIDDVRLRAAHHMLAEAETSLSTIATLLGYSDERGFRRAFKRMTGQTPSGFRAALAGQAE